MTDDGVKMMESVVTLEYRRPATLVARQYARAVRDKRLIAHRCPSCSRVYLPPRGYCPICVVETTDDHQVQLPDRGVVVTFTIVKPDPTVYGQQRTERYCRITTMLEGSNVTLMGEIKGVELDDIRTGMHVRAVWADELSEEEAAATGRGYGGGGIRHWEPSGQPDLPQEELNELLAKARSQ